jgi:16S rRNA (uracil1498-N3)-methyltransferase
MLRNPEHFLFFSDSVGSEGLVIGGEQSRHARSVLRADTGDTLLVTDGEGIVYCCTVDMVYRDRLVCTIRSRQRHAPPLPGISLFIGLPEKDAFERTIELAAPLGVSRIVPVICRFCQKAWWGIKWEKHAARFRRKIIAGCMQAHNVYIPELSEPVSFDTALSSRRNTTLCVGEIAGKSIFDNAEAVREANEIAAWVGPPGGFSEQEYDAIRAVSRYIPIKLNPYRLRTELAAAVLTGCIRGVVSG